MTDEAIKPASQFQATGPGAVPHVTLAGQQWPIPLLAPRQNRLVIPTVVKLSEKFGAGFNYNEFDEATVDDLCKVVYTGLTRAHPALKWEDFMDWPISMTDLLAAFMVVSMQTGLSGGATAAGAEGSEAVGEAPAAG